jgi:hypothetical protein
MSASPIISTHMNLFDQPITLCINTPLPIKAIQLECCRNLSIGRVDRKVSHQANVALTIRLSKLVLISILDVPMQLSGSISGVSQPANVIQS